MMADIAKKPAWHRIPAFLIAVSILLLAGFTLAQVNRQTKVLDNEIAAVENELRARAHWQSAWPGRMRVLDAMRTMNSSPVVQNKDINIVIMLFHVSDLEQPLEVIRHCPNERRFAQLEEKAAEEIRGKGYEDGGNLNYTGGGGGSTSATVINWSRNMSIDTEEDGIFVFAWSIKAFPLSVALRQLIPVYILTALLLTALALTKKKYATALTR